MNKPFCAYPKTMPLTNDVRFHCNCPSKVVDLHKKKVNGYPNGKCGLKVKECC